MKTFTVEDFKRWGRKGGKRRAEVLSPERRSAIAKKAGKARGKNARGK
jgi:hypothetical protein